MSRSRPGSALLDVVVSLALLGVSGTAMLTLLDQDAHSMRQVRDTERELRGASDELGRLAALDHRGLAAMLGESVRHAWSIRVAEPAPGLFDVAIADTAMRTTLLRTSIYRPDTNDARSHE